MLCQDIIRHLEVLAPAEYAMDWDNVGLLVGKRDSEVKKILIAVDATYEVCQKAIDSGADMIITHHPMIFSKVKNVNSDTVIGKKLLMLIEAGICCYAMHTNYDTRGGMAKHAADMLELKNTEVLEETLNGEGIGQIGILDNTMTLSELGEKTKKIFGLKNVMIYGDINSSVDKIAICPGSGKSVIDTAAKKGVQCLITGDIGHHEGIDGMELGLSIIDASHYGIEKIFINYIYDYLKEYCQDVELTIADVGVPYVVI